MTTITVTGGHGQIGWHLRCHAHANGINTIPTGRQTSPDDLADALGRSEAVIHLAGVNRAADQQITDGNIGAAQTLAAALATNDRPLRVVYADSIQSSLDNVYGRAKAAAHDTLADTCNRHGHTFTAVRIQNVFGEHFRPFYNSVVATFCHQIARGHTPTIINDRTIDLVHAGQVATTLLNHATSDKPAPLTGQATKVGDLLQRLHGMTADYDHGIIPSLEPGPLGVPLFNTLRSHLFPRRYPHPLTLNTDNRGHLYETVKARICGHTFLSHTRPAITRGNHYHLRKIERFLVTHGHARIRLRRLLTNHTTTFHVGGDAPAFVDIPTLHTHDITNIGDAEVVTLFWANEIFDPDDTDTYPELV